MTEKRRAPIKPVSATIVALLAAALTLACAPAALGNASVTQNLAPGGSLSTGSTVSPSEPVQLSVTSSQGGRFTINEETSPAARLQVDGGHVAMDWVGPQFSVASPNCVQGCLPPEEQLAAQTFTVTALIAGAGLPEPPTFGAEPQWRPDPQAICANPQGPLPGFCKGSKAGIAQLCWSFSTALAICNDSPGSSPAEIRPQLLPNGDVQITMQVKNGTASPLSFGVGTEPWSCSPAAGDTVIVNSPDFDHGTLDDLIKHGIYYDNGCDLKTTLNGEITVTRAAARKLHLHSTVVGRVSNGPGNGVIELTSAAKSAFRRRVPHYIEVHVALQARGTAPGESWSYAKTLRVKRPSGGGGIG